MDAERMAFPGDDAALVEAVNSANLPTLMLAERLSEVIAAAR